MARAKADAGGEKQPSMMAMVKESLRELGGDAKPQEIQDHIKQKYGREIPTNIISNYKSVSKRKGGAAGNGRRRGRPPKAAAGGLRIDHFETIRTLVNELGADQVKRLVEVVG